MLDKNKEEVVFHIQRIYVKDISFEAPGTPRIFQLVWNPNIQINLNNNFIKVSIHVYEVVLCVTVTAMIENQIAFICQVKQAGIFNISGLSEKQILHCVNVYCLDILFPYARECINSQISRGTFPFCNLDPINFDSLFIKFLKNMIKKSV